MSDITEGKSSARQSGCTAVVILLSKKDLYIANCGDSRCIIQYKNMEVIQPLEDHKPENPKEKKRI